MRTLVLFGVALLSLFAAGAARAAPVPVDLTFVPDGADPSRLDLFLSIAPDAPLQEVTALCFHIVSNPTTDFSISPSALAHGIDQFLPTGFSFKIVSPNDLHLEIVGTFLAPYETGFASPGTQNMLIGTLSNAQGVTIDSFVPGIEDGGTVQDQYFAPVVPYRVTIGDTSRIFVFEPEAGLLVVLGFAGLVLGTWCQERRPATP
jgi:hypothetical protein